jgi:signal transduction histidine kinase
MIWDWLHRRPLLVDLGLAVAVWLPSLAAASHHPHFLLLALLVTAETLPLLWRRRHPLAVVLVVTPLAVAAVGFGIVLPFQLGVALYTLAASDTPRARRSGAGLAAIVAIGVSFAVSGRIHEFGAPAAHVVFLAAAWLLGDSIGSRRAYVREIEEKAERLERERETEARRAVAEEQARIARELHDVVAHALSVIVVQAGAAEEVFELDPVRARTPIRAIDAAARAALSDLRRVLGLLHEDAELEPQPGLARLDSLIEQVRATGLVVSVEIEGTPQALPATVDLSAYRIIQEALTNTIKHADADTARVHVRYGSDLELDIRDDGRGTTNGIQTGNGLIGMRERAAMLGGSVVASTPATGGYLVSARIPIGGDR